MTVTLKAVKCHRAGESSVILLMATRLQAVSLRSAPQVSTESGQEQTRVSVCHVAAMDSPKSATSEQGTV